MKASRGREMPKYKCHKEVWALKIKHVEYSAPTIEKLEAILERGEEPIGAVITPAEEGYAAFPVSQKYVRKHDPKPGGYYVVYQDGYESFSPAQVFEEGYTRL